MEVVWNVAWDYSPIEHSGSKDSAWYLRLLSECPRPRPEHPMFGPRERRPRRSRAPLAAPAPPPPAGLPPSCRLLWPAAECGDAGPCRCAPPRTARAPPARGWPAAALVLGVLVLAFAQPAQALSPNVDLNSQKESGVCTSMDIRNSPQMFQVLSGCRVIEGFLQILLFDRFNETAYANLSFPELREITGYLFMYRVNGLRTLSTLFPNLAVIRGHKLFNNYAFVLYEMMNMQEIGLYSLTDISRGSVRIEKNYMMCYVSTIDWDVIAPNGKEGHFIKDNKPENECPVCPGEDGSLVGPVCPTAPRGAPPHANKRHLCWNQDHCQKVCKTECGRNTCSASGQCCDASCLGGCSGPLLDNCTVCRDLSIGDLRDRKCIRDCPNNTFKHQDRRCITESECRNLPRPKEINESEKVDRPYKPINGTCTLECPPNFNEEIVRGVAVCQPCVGTCRKECPSMNVDSIQAIERLRGCTHIMGSLEISVRGGGSIVKELEEGLGQIQEITGSLKVARSYPLVSLNFLKSLRVIRGEQKFENDKWNAFSVTDNQNLQELWDWDTHGDIDIMRGKLYFHFNPKLCIEKIEPLRHMARATEFTELEVARNSNGDKVACNVTILNVQVQSRSQEGMLLTWKAFFHDDPRSLLGYVVHTIEAPHKNITLYEGRDACGGDGWHVDDVQVPKEDTVYHLLTHLKPYTQYAIYVKTLTVATERLGAQSNIMYVRTLPGEPSKPRITMAVSLSPGSLILKWEPPDQPNGNVTQYKVAVEWEEDREDFLMQRNYCVEPLVPDVPKPIVEVEDPISKEKEEKDKKDEKCQCESKTWNDDEVLGQITFEDQLQNQVYQKRDTLDETRRRRDVEAAKARWTAHPFSDNQITQPHQPQEFQTIKNNGVYDTFAKVVDKQTALNISDLRHYASHSISIWACREVEKDELVEKLTIANCSLKSIVTARTMKLEGADDVTGVVYKVLQSNQSLGMVRMEWTEPARPNGLIITYQIQYKRIDMENHSPTTECITRQQFKNGGKSYTIKGLNAGNYSVRIMATSLAGNGNYSAVKYFFIEAVGGGASVPMIVGMIVGGIALVGILVGLALFLQRRYMSPPPPPPTKLIASVNPEYVSSVYVPDEWEVPRDKIQLIKELGQGSFGMVYEGIAQELGKDGTEIRCAVKTVNEHATDRERIEFLNEASVMKAFDTAHVVRLLGVVSRGQPTLVVMELMASGDLKSYLRSHRPDTDKPRNAQPPSLVRILQMAMEIADGMAYLSAKKFVHRDLAARNCMVAGDLTVKVGDFGMTRDIYETDYYRKGSKGLLPVRWMSPESLKDGVFTSSSDVWSYGVVLWEMATLASQPYQGLSNDQVLRYVIDGGVMERPENCPDRLYQLMQLTWQHRPQLRPTFLRLVSLLATDANPVFRANSFFFSTQGQDTFNQVQQAPAGVPEEPEPSVSGGQLGSWAQGLASLDDDSSPPASPAASPRHSPSYRDMIRLVPFGERARADPHEMEALVGLSQSAPPPPGPKASPPQTTPNGYLPRSGNNGNPSSLSTSRC